MDVSSPLKKIGYGIGETESTVDRQFGMRKV